MSIDLCTKVIEVGACEESWGLFLSSLKCNDGCNMIFWYCYVSDIEQHTVGMSVFDPFVLLFPFRHVKKKNTELLFLGYYYSILSYHYVAY